MCLASIQNLNGNIIKCNICTSNNFHKIVHLYYHVQKLQFVQEYKGYSILDKCHYVQNILKILDYEFSMSIISKTTLLHSFNFYDLLDVFHHMLKCVLYLYTTFLVYQCSTFGYI